MIANQNEFQQELEPGSHPASPIFIEGRANGDDEFWPGLTKREYYAAHSQIPDMFVMKLCRERYKSETVTAEQFMAMKAALAVTYADGLLLALQEPVE